MTYNNADWNIYSNVMQCQEGVYNKADNIEDWNTYSNIMQCQ